MTVGGRLQDGLGRNDGAGARAVLDHHGVAEFLSHGSADQPRKAIHRATRRVAHDPTDGPARPMRLRMGGAWQERSSAEHRRRADHVASVHS
jgi:hypothetical protein